MGFLRSTIAIVAAVLVTGAASADTVKIKYNEVAQGTENGFGFSLMHTPTNDAGGGSLLYRMYSTFTILWDNTDDGDGAGSITVTELSAQLFLENNFNPNNVGAMVGTITLRESSMLNVQDGTDQNTHAGSQFVEGLLKLTLSLDGEADRDLDIQFNAENYNALANRFDPDNDFALGLWGATPEVFQNNIDGDSLGFDLFGSNGQIVPLPTAANIGLLGFGFVSAGASMRRRRA